MLQNVLLTLIADFKPVDSCIMGGPLLVTFSDIHMVKMENSVVIQSKPIFYRRLVDDIFSIRKLGENVLFGQLKIIIQIII